MYRLSGVGTRELSRRKPGEELDILGPLGNGFDLTSAVADAAAPAKAAVVGGGIGVFPMLLLSRRLYEAGMPPDIFIGFRDSKSSALTRELGGFSDNINIMSDDGSIGGKGPVTDAFVSAVGAGAVYGRVYACGPVPMLRALRNICETAGVTAQFSMEQRMGCGIGACLVCACAVNADTPATGGKNAPETGGKNAPDSGIFTYARVCRDGPVFSSDEIIFE